MGAVHDISMSSRTQESAKQLTNFLATPLTPLIGRQNERRAVAQLLRRTDVRLVTLSGPGGAGKTRLALQLAVDMAGDFADGLYWVALASLNEPALVIKAIAQAIGIVESGNQSLQETLRTYLADKRALLVLDNFEHLLSAAPLVAALWWYWWVRGHVSEGRTWLERLLLQSPADGAATSHRRLRATALYRLAFLALTQNDNAHGRALSEQSLELFRTLGDGRGIAWTRYMIGLATLWQGEPNQASVYYVGSLALFRAMNDTRGVLWALNDLSNLAHMRNDLAQATELASEHLALARAIGNPREIAAGLGHWSGIVQAQGHYAQAQAYNEEALALLQKVGDVYSVAITLHSLAYLAQLQQDYPQAEALFKEGLQCYQQVGNRAGVARCLVGLAAVDEVNGNVVCAARLFGAANAYYAQLEHYLAPDEQASWAESQAADRRALGEAAFAIVWSEGRAMTPNQAIATAEPAASQRSLHPASTSSPLPMTIPAPSADAPATPATTVVAKQGPFAVLSEREQEVLRLLAQGLSYADIADQLVISPRTVNRHLTSIYTKLNVTSRHAATRFALAHGLT